MIHLSDQQAAVICGGGTIILVPVNVAVQNGSIVQNNIATPIAVGILKGSASAGPITQVNGAGSGQNISLPRYPKP